ncbi:Gag-Pol polyprotein [Trichinella zimbabwensis]|uniref:Gag-Pol polyprotein n=1 Tax=Trichinella zimbabwensis TaxID=268475 RepID=A0A0V1HZA0_9BILA|nr:Gag-Pol polyprotein [Trichinella zimbabwensis]
MQYNVQYIQKISAEEFKIEGRLRYTIREFRDLIFNAPTEREPFTVFKQLCLNRSTDSEEQGGVEECSGSDVPVELDSQIWSLITHHMTDRGRQFNSQLWPTITKLIGCKHIATSAYHPQSNGLIERFHRHLKSALIAHMHQNGIRWTEALPLVLLGLRSAVKADLCHAPAELIYVSSLRLPA